MTSRFRLVAALLGASLAAPMLAAGPASADLVPLPPPPTIDPSCLSAPDPVQCTLALLQGTVSATPLPPVPSLPPLPGTDAGGTGGTTGTSTNSLGGVPTATGGTTQQRSTGHTAVTTKKKRHYSLHRSHHHHRR